jgi:hypothetical protein
VVVLGHPNYYPRFGFVLAKEQGVKLPFDVPDEACMVLELLPHALEGIQGSVEYPPDFYEKKTDVQDDQTYFLDIPYIFNCLVDSLTNCAILLS